MNQFFLCRFAMSTTASLFILFETEQTLAQNVGIGIDPIRARLETRGLVGNTLTLFGQDQNGVSLVANPPGINFNSYSNGGLRSIQAGMAGNISFDAGLGRFEFFRCPAVTGPDQALTQIQLLSIEPNGNLIANVFRYPSPRTFYYSIGGADFSARNSDETVIKEATGGAAIVGQNGSVGLAAPVHLPHGATITGVTFHFLDESVDTNLTMNLSKYTPATSSYTSMATVSSNGNPGATSITINTITQPNVDNINSTYVIRVASLPTVWPTGLAIKAVMISYAVIEGN